MGVLDHLCDPVATLVPSLDQAQPFLGPFLCIGFLSSYLLVALPSTAPGRRGFDAILVSLLHFSKIILYFLPHPAPKQDFTQALPGGETAEFKT